MMSTKSKSSAPQTGREAGVRRAMLGKIHIQLKRWKVLDPDYRALLGQLFPGRNSAAQLSLKELGELLDHLARLGGGVNVRRPVRVEEAEPQLKLIRFLWDELAQFGALHDSSEVALRHFVRRVTKVDSLRWLTPLQASAVIEGLKAWRRRANRAKAEESR
jgi:hypothetical protein